MFRSYSRPEAYLNQALARGELYRALHCCFSGWEEQQLWQLYLACMANSLGSPGSFRDFCRSFGSKETARPVREPEKELQRAELLLRGFVP